MVSKLILLEERLQLLKETDLKSKTSVIERNGFEN